MQVSITTLTVGSSLTVALLVPDKAEKIYAVVGATAVCVVCYVIPVFIQLQLYRRRRQIMKQHQVGSRSHLLQALGSAAYCAVMCPACVTMRGSSTACCGRQAFAHVRLCLVRMPC